jgi:hypothetical protein
VFDTREAERIGLLHAVVDPADLLPTVLAKAAEIAAHAPLAVWMTKETMWQNVDAPSLRHALDLENRTQVMCTATGELHRSWGAGPGAGPPRRVPRRRHRAMEPVVTVRMSMQVGIEPGDRR